MIKGYKIRIYPNKEQQEKMWKHIHSCRFIWNYMLDYQEKHYQNGGKFLGHFDMVNLLTPLKQKDEYSWLNDVNRACLANVCGDLSKAYKAFFDKIAKHPKFKSRKRSKSNYPCTKGKTYIFDEQFVQVQSIGKVKYKTDFVLPFDKNSLVNPRISYINGKWMLSFGLEVESQDYELNDIPMGIDLGVKESAVVAYGDEKIVFHNINKSSKMKNLDKKIKHVQRGISRKYEANKVGNKYVKTNNIMREEEKLRKLYAKQSNIRSNFIHQSTHKLVSLLPNKVVMEDLNVVGMMKNRHLSKAIQKQCFAEWRRQMEYKCNWRGIKILFADRFYPSSKTCHECGCIHTRLKLKDRTFICPECGYTVDRDFNAALNLSMYSV